MGHIGRKALLTLVTVVLVMSGSAATALATTGAFTVISSPNPGTNNNQLFVVAATSANNAWSVGYYQSATCLCTPTSVWAVGTANGQSLPLSSEDVGAGVRAVLR